jgi:hypothetical protein
VLLQLAYLGVTNALALLRLLPMSDRAEPGRRLQVPQHKDAEILALRHQITVLQRQLHGEKVRFTRADRAWLAALLHRLPRDVLRNLRLLVHPETVLRWHRDLIAPLKTGTRRCPRSSPRSRTGPTPNAGIAAAPAPSNAPGTTATPSRNPASPPAPATQDPPPSASGP